MPITSDKIEFYKTKKGQAELRQRSFQEQAQTDANIVKTYLTSKENDSERQDIVRRIFLALSESDIQYKNSNEKNFHSLAETNRKLDKEKHGEQKTPSDQRSGLTNSTSVIFEAISNNNVPLTQQFSIPEPDILPNSAPSITVPPTPEPSMSQLSTKEEKVDEDVLEVSSLSKRQI